MSNASLARDATSTPNTFRGTLIGSGAVLLWGTWPTLAVGTGTLPAFETLALAYAVAFVCFAGRRLLTGSPVVYMLRMPLGVFVFGLTGVLGNLLFLLLAARHIGAGTAQVISYLWPIMVMLLSAAIARAGLSPGQLAGVLLAFAGAALVLGPEGSFTAHPLGVTFAFLSGVSWAAYSLYRMYHAGGPGDATGAFCGGAALVCLIITAGTSGFVVPTVPQALAAIGMGLAPIGTAILLWDYGMRRGNPRTLSLLAYTTPLFGVLLLHLTGAAAPGPLVALGAVLVIGGTLLGTRRNRH